MVHALGGAVHDILYSLSRAEKGLGKCFYEPIVAADKGQKVAPRCLWGLLQMALDEARITMANDGILRIKRGGGGKGLNKKSCSGALQSRRINIADN